MQPNPRGSFFDEFQPEGYYKQRRTFYPVSSNNFGVGELTRLVKDEEPPEALD